MAAGLTVGDFSRATHLSVKTLHHYHQVGLLEPATVNPDTGYRYYSAGQIAIARPPCSSPCRAACAPSGGSRRW
jgi:MerR family regulatory protein